MSERVCPGLEGSECGKFLASSLIDPHPTCSSCRGRSCSHHSSCEVCAAWDEEQWSRYEDATSTALVEVSACYIYIFIFFFTCLFSI